MAADEIGRSYEEAFEHGHGVIKYTLKTYRDQFCSPLFASAG